MLPAFVALALAGEAAPAPAPVETTIAAGIPADIAQAIWQIELHRLEPNALDAWVAHPSPDVRARVALALGRLRNEAALASLGTLVVDPDPNVRTNAAFALGQTPGAGPLLGRRWPQEKDREVRNRLAVALGKQGGPEAIDMLLPALSGVGSIYAADGLGRLGVRKVEGASSNRVVAALLDTFEIPVGDTRRRAAWALSRMGLTATSADNAMRMRETALKDGDASVRAWVLRAWLGVATEAARLEVLGALVHDPAASVRITVARGLAKHTGDGLGPLLEVLLADPDLDVRLEAIAATGTAHQVDARALLAKSFLAPDAVERAAALRALAAKDALPEAPSRWTDPSEPMVVRIAAVESLTDRNRLLALALHAPEPAIRSAAAGVLLGGDTPRLTDVFALLEGDDMVIAETAAQTLAEHPDPSAEEPLLRYLGRKGLRPARAASGVKALAAVYATGRLPRPGPAAAAVIRPYLRQPTLEADAERLAALLNVTLPRPRHVLNRLPALAEALEIRSARIWTNEGEIRVTLFPEDAPYTVWNFARLAEEGYYDGLVFHRVVPDFVIQTGDPRGDGWGGPGYEIPDEINDVPYGTGTLGMALSGPDTGGSQWFITLSPQPHLDGTYTVFGRVSYGMRNAADIEVGDTIDHIEIERVKARL